MSVWQLELGDSNPRKDRLDATVADACGSQWAPSALTSFLSHTGPPSYTAQDSFIDVSHTAEPTVGHTGERFPLKEYASGAQRSQAAQGFPLPPPRKLRPAGLPLIYHSPSTLPPIRDATYAPPDHLAPETHGFVLRSPPRPKARRRLPALPTEASDTTQKPQTDRPTHRGLSVDRPLGPYAYPEPPGRFEQYPSSMRSYPSMTLATKVHPARLPSRGRSVADIEASSGSSYASPRRRGEPYRLSHRGDAERGNAADETQLAIFNEVFGRTQYPGTKEREDLARRLGMTSRSVQIWFQNRRRAARVQAQSMKQLAEAEARSREMRGLPDKLGDEPALRDDESGLVSIGGVKLKREVRSPGVRMGW